MTFENSLFWGNSDLGSGACTPVNNERMSEDVLFSNLFDRSDLEPVQVTNQKD